MSAPVATVARHVYVPRGTAVKTMHCRDPELLLSGPAGTGKSRVCLEKLHTMAMLNPGMRALMVRKVRDSLSSTALVTYREHVAVESLLTGAVTYYGGSTSEPPQYRYQNGSRLMIGGMDKPTKVMSSEYDLIYVQEAIELNETDWENLTTRLRNGRVSFQQLLADTNPDVPTHWLHQRVTAGRTTMLDTRHEDNPVLFGPDGQTTDVGAAYIDKLDNLTGVRKQRLRYGRWVAAEGLVYEDFDRDVHVRRIVDPPESWPRYWVVDFGYTNPFVLQCWAVDDDGRLHLYRELYRTKRLVEDHARDILGIVRRPACDACQGSGPDDRECLKRHEWREPKPRQVICDHDAEDRATLQRHLGLTTVAAKKTVSDGIQAVQHRMKVQRDGKPRIFFSPTALVERDPELETAKKPTCTLDELPGYVWDRAREGTAAAEKSAKEAPVKANDHGMDCVRYVCAHLDLKSRPKVRWL